jgi:hypothetical protein
VKRHRRKLTELEQGRLQEALWKRGLSPAQAIGVVRRQLREAAHPHPVRPRHRHRAREVTRQRHRLAALARKRPDLVAMAAFHESYWGTNLRGRKRPGSNAIATFRESYRRPAR